MTNLEGKIVNLPTILPLSLTIKKISNAPTPKIMINNQVP